MHLKHFLGFSGGLIKAKAWPSFSLHLLDHGWLVVVMRLSPGLAEVPPYIEPARASEDG